MNYLKNEPMLTNVFLYFETKFKKIYMFKEKKLMTANEEIPFV